MQNPRICSYIQQYLKVNFPENKILLVKQCQDITCISLYSPQTNASKAIGELPFTIQPIFVIWQQNV